MIGVDDMRVSISYTDQDGIAHTEIVPMMEFGPVPYTIIERIVVRPRTNSHKRTRALWRRRGRW